MMATLSQARWQRGARGKCGVATLGIISLLTNVGIASIASIPGALAMEANTPVGFAPRSRLLA